MARLPFFFQAHCFEHGCIGKIPWGNITEIFPFQRTLMHRVSRTDKQDHKFTSTELHLFYQDCYHILITNEQLIEMKTRELLTIVLRYSSETVTHVENNPVIFRQFVDT